MKEAWRTRISLALALAVVCLLGISTSAAAAIVVGQTSPGPVTESTCDYESSYDELQATVAAGTGYTVPTAGVITSWSTNEGPGGGLLSFKVFRPVGASFLVVAQDGPRPLVPGALNNFPVNIPVQAGDIIGVGVVGGSATSCVFRTELPGDRIVYKEGLTAPGQTFTPENSFTENRLNLSAVLLPPPAIAAIGPASGSIKGAGVVISGLNFAGVTGVSFGSVPATFAVNSESQITAVAPPSKTLGAVPVTVTTVAGTATAAQPFTYEGCRVPKLKNKKLKAAKKTIRKSDCKVGNVKKLHDATAKTGKVVKQNPPPGKILVPGAKVKVTLDEA